MNEPELESGHVRSERLRYPTDLTDEEFALIALRIPPAQQGCSRRSVNLRAVVNHCPRFANDWERKNPRGMSFPPPAFYPAQDSKA